MRVACGNPKLVVGFIVQNRPEPLPERGRAAPDVHRHVKDAPPGDKDKLALRVGMLVMQATHRASRGAGMVVLHKRAREAGLGVVPFAEEFEEKAPVIAENARFEQKHSRERRFFNSDGHSRYLRPCRWGLLSTFVEPLPRPVATRHSPERAPCGQVVRPNGAAGCGPVASAHSRPVLAGLARFRAAL